MESIKWIDGYLKKYKHKYCFALMLVLSNSLINMVNPFVYGQLLDKVFIGKEFNLFLER